MKLWCLMLDVLFGNEVIDKYNDILYVNKFCFHIYITRLHYSPRYCDRFCITLQDIVVGSPN